MKLELIAFNIDSCLMIEQTKAHRVELCSSPGEGGTTPSYGMIREARKILSKELYPIIRPRGGDFLFRDEEFEIMKQDVLLCKKLGCDGVVIGSLFSDGSVNRDQAKKLVEIAYPMGVTFHRAFDRINDAVTSLEEIIDTGCERILTSGLRPSAVEGIDLIKQLNNKADGRIIIMPGSSVRSSNLSLLIQETGCTEFHSSARINSEGNMQFKNAEMKESLEFPVIDIEEVEAMLEILDGVLTSSDFKQSNT